MTHCAILPRPTSLAHRPDRRRPAAGFTTIELLVVIGVIVVLIGIASVGYRHLGTGGQENQTKVTLEALKNLMAAHDRLVGLTGIATANVRPAPDPKDTRQAADLVKLTQGTMRELMRIPDNKKAVAQLPTTSVKTPTQLGVSGPGITPEPVVPVDAWGTCIMLVPEGGLTQVTVAGTAVPIIKAPDGRPFFASAGPDKDFRKGDDNLYSFNQ